MEKFKIKFSYLGKPEAYARERAARGRFYNPKGNKARQLRKYCLDNMKIKDKLYLEKLLKNPDNQYFVNLDMKFYMPIPKGDSKKKKDEKLSGITPPSIRPDIDNYLKFVMDALHEVIYDDDKRVTKISGEKCYGEEPRTEINVEISVLKIIEEN